MAFRERFSFLMGFSMGKRPDFEYHVGKWLKYDRSGYNSSHPSLGSPLDLGNPWRPLATLGDMPENAWKWPKWPFSGMSPMVPKEQLQVFLTTFWFSEPHYRVSHVAGHMKTYVTKEKIIFFIFKSSGAKTSELWCPKCYWRFGKGKLSSPFVNETNALLDCSRTSELLGSLAIHGMFWV